MLLLQARQLRPKLTFFLCVIAALVKASNRPRAAAGRPCAETK